MYFNAYLVEIIGRNNSNYNGKSCASQAVYRNKNKKAKFSAEFKGILHYNTICKVQSSSLLRLKHFPGHFNTLQGLPY